MIGLENQEANIVLHNAERMDYGRRFTVTDYTKRSPPESQYGKRKQHNCRYFDKIQEIREIMNDDKTTDEFKIERIVDLI